MNINGASEDSSFVEISLIDNRPKIPVATNDNIQTLIDMSYDLGLLKE